MQMKNLLLQIRTNVIVTIFLHYVIEYKTITQTEYHLLKLDLSFY